MHIPTTEIEALMRNNRRETDGHTYTVPSPTSYPYQWFWDSCFHALILSHFDMPAAIAELDSLVVPQYDDGFIAHVMYWKRADVLNVPWLSEYTSDLIQPPILAPTVEMIYERSGDKAFLERLFPALERFHDFLQKERDIRGEGLCGYVNPDESGEDNSPRFDASLDLDPQHPVENHLDRRYALFTTHKECKLDARCTAKSFWAEDVPLNTFIVWSYQAMSRLATELNDKSLVAKYDARAKQVATAMRTQMFKNGQFHPLLSTNAVKTPEDTWSRFAPLLTKQYSKEEARTLIEHDLINPNSFWLKHGVPTVAKNSDAYDPEEPTWGEEWQHPHWRGPIWMNIHWFVAHGLKQYGYHELANTIKKRSLKLVAENGFREYYHPETGVGMGARNFTWGALVIDM